MKIELRDRIPLLAVGGVCLALAGVVAAELYAPTIDTDGIVARAAAIDLPIEAGRPATDAIALVQDVLTRPVFTPGRRPPPPVEEAEDAEEEEAETPPFEARLAGVLIGPETSEALFAKDGEESIAVAEGDEIDGWTVDSIEMDRVVISSPRGELVLLPTPAEPAMRGAPRRNPAAKAPRSSVSVKAAPPPQPRAAKPPKAMPPPASPAPRKPVGQPIQFSPKAPASAVTLPQATIAPASRPSQLLVRAAPAGNTP